MCSSTDLKIKLAIKLPNVQVVLIDEMQEDHHDTVGVYVHVQFTQTHGSAIHDVFVYFLFDVSQVADAC